MYHDLLSRCLKSIVLCCRYQILGVFLLIQLCIIAAECLRRTNLSSIASSVHQTSLGTHQASAGSDSRTVALIEIFFEFAFSHIIISRLNYDYFFPLVMSFCRARHTSFKWRWQFGNWGLWYGKLDLWFQTIFRGDFPVWSRNCYSLFVTVILVSLNLQGFLSPFLFFNFYKYFLSPQNPCLGYITKLTGIMDTKIGHIATTKFT